MKTELRISGMSCQNCVNHVREALSNVKGVTHVEVDLQKGTAEVSGVVNELGLIEAVARAGYQARAEK